MILATPVASWWLIGDLTNEEARQLAAGGVELGDRSGRCALVPWGMQLQGLAGISGAPVSSSNSPTITYDTCSARIPLTADSLATCCGQRPPGQFGWPVVNACQLCPASPPYWRRDQG